MGEHNGMAMDIYLRVVVLALAWAAADCATIISSSQLQQCVNDGSVSVLDERYVCSCCLPLHHAHDMTRYCGLV